MASLIGFDKNRENLQFKGHSKLSINFMANYLYVEPENEEFKLISAAFTWTYVTKKNLLFVFADHDFMDFCLVFKNEQICQKTFNYLTSTQKNDTATDECKIDNSFLNPIFEKIAANLTFNSDLIETIATWHQLLDADDKEKYTQLMKDYGIYDVIVVPVQVEKAKELNIVATGNRKRKFAEMKKEVMPKNEMRYLHKHTAKVIPASQFQVYIIRRHRRLIVFTSDEKESFHEYRAIFRSDKFRCVTCDQTAIIDIDDNGEICVGLQHVKHSCKLLIKIPSDYQNFKIIRKPDYEIFKYCAKYSRKYLVVYDSNDRNQCYEYFWDKTKSRFYCRGCESAKLSNKSAALIFNEGTSKEYVGIYYANHKCQKRKVQPEKYRDHFDYVLKPDFEIQKYIFNGKEKQKLIIFDGNDRSKCYRYFYYSVMDKFLCGECKRNAKFVTAKLHQNSEGEEYIILSNVKHVCEMTTYVPPVNNVVFRPPDFKLMETSKNELSRIFLFAKNDPSKCYIFTKHKYSYYCTGCSTKSVLNNKQLKNDSRNTNVYAHLLKEENGDYYIQMKSNQSHICEPKPYQPEKYECIPKTYDFFYYRQKSQPKNVKLAVYSPDNNQLCFRFFYQKANKVFSCSECKKNKKYCNIKVQKDADGKEYFNHDIKKHICKPVKVSSMPKFEIVKEHGLKIESKRKIKINDESKIVRMPDFELRPNKAGVPDRKLILRHSTDKTLFYEYGYDVGDKMFVCRKCQLKKIRVTAKLQKDDENGESFILMGKNNHACQPKKYQLV